MKFLKIFINGMEGGPASYKLGGEREGRTEQIEEGKVGGRTSLS